MRNKLVAANWKMNGSVELVNELLTGFRDAGLGDACEVAVFAPAVYLHQVSTCLAGSAIRWGGQNCSEHDSGAFTGEISVPMLKEAGCSAVLVGHSERRSLYGETNDVCLAKVRAALAGSLTPVLCVGETLAEREAGQAVAVVTEQLSAVVSALDAEAARKLVIAYEPVWAIGTGVTATPEQAQEMHADIRAYLATVSQELAAGMQILYGGSVNGKVAAELFAMPDIDGGLVGGASLKLDEFISICRAAE